MGLVQNLCCFTHCLSAQPLLCILPVCVCVCVCIYIYIIFYVCIYSYVYMKAGVFTLVCQATDMHIACVRARGLLKLKFHLKGWRGRSCCDSKRERGSTRHCRACRDGARGNRNRRKDSRFVQGFAVGARQRLCRAGKACRLHEET